MTNKPLPKPQTAWAVWSPEDGWLRDYNEAIVLFKRKNQADIYANAIKVRIVPVGDGERDNG